MGNKVKRAALAAMIGSVALFGGCLSFNGILGRTAMSLGTAVAADFLFNTPDGFIDLAGNPPVTP